MRTFLAAALPTRDRVALGVLIGELDHHSRRGPGGWWIPYEPELHFVRIVLVPDLAGWRRTRRARAPDAAFCALAPDWISGILSPSTASVGRVKKLAIYAREDARHTCLVDPSLRMLEVLRLKAGRWTILATHAGVDVVRAEPFSETDLEIASLWADTHV